MSSIDKDQTACDARHVVRERAAGARDCCAVEEEERTASIAGLIAARDTKGSARVMAVDVRVESASSLRAEGRGLK